MPETDHRAIGRNPDGGRSLYFDCCMFDSPKAVMLCRWSDAKLYEHRATAVMRPLAFGK